MESFTYDVALSFAGEDRMLVRLVADLLRANGIRVFYDEFERANLWGKELIAYLEEIYSIQSQYVVLFVSKSYLSKDWTNHELKSALNRAFGLKREFILPVALDETKLPGLHKSISYLDSKKLTVQEICDTFLEKIGKKAVSISQPYSFVYRITNQKFSKDMTGRGASITEGRWHMRGMNVIYTSTNISLAMFEMYVHIGNLNLLKNFTWVRYSIPTDILIKNIYESDLPRKWKDQITNYKITQELAKKWFDSTESCILSVPSAIVSEERNYILNPNHQDFKKIILVNIKPFEIDKRL